MVEQHFSVTQKVFPKDVASLLVSAFEGGASRHWCRIVDYRIPPVVEPVLDAGRQDPHVYTPLVLDHMAITRGLHLMAKEYPQHWGNFIAGNDDAETGDVFLQLCLLGKLVYG